MQRLPSTNATLRPSVARGAAAGTRLSWHFLRAGRQLSARLKHFGPFVTRATLPREAVSVRFRTSSASDAGRRDGCRTAYMGDPVRRVQGRGALPGSRERSWHVPTPPRSASPLNITSNQAREA